MPTRRIFCLAALAAAALPGAGMAQNPNAPDPMGVFTGAGGAMSRFYHDLAEAIARNRYSQSRFIRAYFTPELSSLYFRTQKEAGQELSWSIDMDVILNAQDVPQKLVYGSTKPLKVGEREAVVAVTSEAFGKTRTHRYLLRRTSKGWRIDDIFYEDGDDYGLRAFIESARKRRREDMAKAKKPQRS
ncbi:MAG: hypothetical protein ACK4MV_18985 [Beijerinckiaceae bacterium]